MTTADTQSVDRDMRPPKPHPDGIHLNAVEILYLKDIVTREIVRLGHKRLWMQTVGKKSVIEATRDFWCGIRDKIR